MKSLNYENLTNLYTKTNARTISNDFKQIINQSRYGVCGIEMMVNKGVTDFTLVSPSFLRQSDKMKNSYKDYLTGARGFYEGYLYQPFFLPICTTWNGEFIERFQSLSFFLKNNESIFIQWLFKKAFNWQEKAIEMYSSYLLGNDYPFTFRVGRKIQEKMINVMDKFGVSVDVREYIEEAEQKIVSNGYYFKLNIIVNSSMEREKQIIDRLGAVFDQYTYFNNIKLSKVKGKNMLQQIENCIMSVDRKYQILSMREILSLFGGNDVPIIEDVFAENKTQYELQKTVIINDAIELLPDYPIQKVQVKDGLIQDISESLKRVGIASQARVYNPIVTTGIRLTVIQFDIPKEKNLTHLTSKQKDIQAALGVNSLSIEQGDAADTVRMLIPNEQPAIVSLRSLLESDYFKQYCEKNELAFVVGLDEVNNPIVLSLAELRHLLVTGTTGSGKSVFINQLAVTLMLNNTPNELQMIMIDPKMVELQQYANFPHVKEVVTDMDKAEQILFELINEMERRYSTFNDAGVRFITTYNDMVRNGELEDAEIIPYIVCIIDEYADLKDTHPTVEKHIARFAQKARAAGIHLVIGTQRPSVDVISGRIKANIINAISFNLSNTNNYRTVFGTGIPYTLLGKGDGCMKIEGWSKQFQRFQSPILSPDEKIERQVYEDLAEYLNMKYANNSEMNSVEQIETTVELEQEEECESDNLHKLKQIIAETGETRTTELRKHMGVKNVTLSNLMTELVSEGFLEMGKTRREGYKINEEKLNEWMTEHSSTKNMPQ